MKRLVLILMVAPLLVACGGREKRAEKIAEETVVKHFIILTHMSRSRRLLTVRLSRFIRIKRLWLPRTRL